MKIKTLYINANNGSLGLKEFEIKKYSPVSYRILLNSHEHKTATKREGVGGVNWFPGLMDHEVVG